ncbi:hypothetical protein BD779DRAFT_1740144 [Infundibulicybe gibba]|nr:hypothetical protein BD779DRAFT_1740144 [Infundibulicybe gibba]
MRLTLFTLTGLALANAASVPFNGARAHIHQLLTREKSSGGDFDPNEIPSQCQTACNTFSSAITSCRSSTQASCGCSTATEQGLVTCLNCLVGLTPSSVATAQGVVDQFVQNCGSAGVKIPSATVSGGVAGSPTVSGATGVLPTTTHDAGDDHGGSDGDHGGSATGLLPTTTHDAGDDHGGSATGLLPTASHDAGDDHGGSSGNSGPGSSGNSNSGNSGNGSSNSSPTTGANTSSNTGTSSSSNSSSGGSASTSGANTSGIFVRVCIFNQTFYYTSSSEGYLSITATAIPRRHLGFSAQQRRLLETSGQRRSPDGVSRHPVPKPHMIVSGRRLAADVKTGR